MDEAERRRLVTEHLPIVQAIAHQVRKQVSENLELDELVGYGNEGLVDAATRFDPRYGVKFSTFAWHRIRGAIYDGLRQMGQLKRGDYARLQIALRANEVLENLAERERGAQGAPDAVPRTPTVEDDLRAMYHALSSVTASYVASLEALSEQGVQIVADTPHPDEQLDLKQVEHRVRKALPALPEKERHFIEKHYFQGKTLLEAGAELGLSKSWASRLHARAIDLLRAQLGEGRAGP